jgi:hypothetical protein
MSFSKLSSLGGDVSSNHFNPDQPRVPGGQAGGGRWTRLGGLLGLKASAENDAVFEGAPSTLSSKLPDDAVRQAFEDSNTVWRPVTPRRLFKSAPLHPDQAFDLFDLYSQFNGPDGQTVLQLKRREPKFTAFGFSRGESDKFVFSEATVKRLSQEEVRKMCTQFDTVQRVLNLAYENVLRDLPGAGNGKIGSAMHKLMKNTINHAGNEDLQGVAITKLASEFDRDHIYAERSFMEGQPEPKDASEHYGEKGSLRPDAVEKSFGAAVQRLDPDRACIYEHGIGKDMKIGRAISLGEVTEEAFRENHFKEFIVIQMRPRQWRPR